MSLDFVDNYQRIRRQFYTPRPEPVSQPKTVAMVRKRYVYHAPIGPRKPLWADQIKRAAEEISLIKSTKRLADEIVNEVCQKHGITVTELLSERRPKRLTDVRQEVYYRLSTETTWSLPRIGRYLAGRDHTTVLHGKRRFEERLMLGEVKL